jgi:hypothetical protein
MNKHHDAKVKLLLPAADPGEATKGNYPARTGTLPAVASPGAAGYSWRSTAQAIRLLAD